MGALPLKELLMNGNVYGLSMLASMAHRVRCIDIPMSVFSNSPVKWRCRRDGQVGGLQTRRAGHRGVGRVHGLHTRVARCQGMV